MVREGGSHVHSQLIETCLDKKTCLFLSKDGGHMPSQFIKTCLERKGGKCLDKRGAMVLPWFPYEKLKIF